MKYLIESNKRGKKEFFIHSNTLLLVQGNLPEEVNIENVKKKIEKAINRKLFKDLDWIYVGQFPELEAREVQSVYLNGAIYITNVNQTEQSLYEAIIHELGHSIESSFREFIYGDSEVQAEFISKRKKLKEILKSDGYTFEDPTVFLRQEYNPDFDNFLYKTVGYDKLNQLCVGLFVSPYAATSIREYFANGFEHFFLDHDNYLEKISPRLYRKIFKLTKKAQ